MVEKLKPSINRRLKNSYTKTEALRKINVNKKKSLQLLKCRTSIFFQNYGVFIINSIYQSTYVELERIITPINAKLHYNNLFKRYITIMNLVIDLN